MDLYMDSFTSFADYFFDNLIKDWIVQSKINRSLDGCERFMIRFHKFFRSLKNVDMSLAENIGRQNQNLPVILRILN